MGIDNILREEISAINRNIIKRRRSLKDLLEDPVIECSGRRIKLDMECLKRIEEFCNLPLDEILLPITFFIPAGLDEGYLQDGRDSRVVESLGVTVRFRNSRYWVKKYAIRELISRCPGCFQSIVVP